MRLWRAVAAVVLLGVASGCEAILALRRFEQPATLTTGGNHTVVEVPDTVARAVPFEVRFTSYESKCTDRSREDVLVANDSIAIHSYVVRAAQCGDALAFLPHTVQIRVDTAGKYSIRLHGWTSNSTDDFVVSRDIVVR